tara:strand:+ start:150 stop:605 length:456 start_codon:yes stop_codon:yes gene_type:complete
MCLKYKYFIEYLKLKLNDYKISYFYIFNKNNLNIKNYTLNYYFLFNLLKIDNSSIIIEETNNGKIKFLNKKIETIKLKKLIKNINLNSNGKNYNLNFLKYNLYSIDKNIPLMYFFLKNNIEIDQHSYIIINYIDSEKKIKIYDTLILNDIF